MLSDLELVVSFFTFISVMNAILLSHLCFDIWFYEMLLGFINQMMIVVKRFEIYWISEIVLLIDVFSFLFCSIIDLII
jgi:hypothetical protein